MACQISSCLLLICLLVGWTLADQVVFLDRPSYSSTFEPYFNPKYAIANVGENIQFVARFQPLSAVLLL